jgi:predicted permease
MIWLKRLIHRDKQEEQLEKELRDHLIRHVADLVAGGHTPAAAWRQARLEIGGPEQVKEECRDARGTRWAADLLQDTSYGLRILRQKPGFSTVALLTLALGIGATTVMFTMINGVLLKPLPYPDPDRLLTLQERTDFSTSSGNLWSFSYPNYLDCKREVRSLEMAASRYSSGTISEPGEAEYVPGRMISSDLFSVLGVSLFRGRAFVPDEDRLGAAPVIILSYAIWQRRYAGSDSAIGTRLVLDEKPYTIVGITPRDFQLTGDVFTLLGQSAEPLMQNRDSHRVRALARLRPGARLVEAQTELAVIGRRLAAQYPKSNHGRTFIADVMHPDVTDVRSTLWLLLGAVSLVLLIACANIASLLLARAVSRERELAMRVALGAGRGRLVRQCLTESAILGLSGGLLGILLAAVGIRPFLKFWPGSLPRAEEVQLDWHVLLFAIGTSLACGLLFGLAPALRAPARDLEKALRAGSRTVSGGSRHLHSAFVIAEIAISVVLLVSAGMLGRTLVRLSALDPGINIRNVLITRMALSPHALASPEQTHAAWKDALDRIGRVPGVQAVAMVDTVPMREGYNELDYWTTPGLPPANERPVALATSVTPDYLNVMGLPLRQGRFLNDRDRMGTEQVIVIDDVMARHTFGQESAIGKHLWIPEMSPEPVVIVGVVGHVRHWGLAGDDQAQVRAQFYYPFAQVPDRFLRRWSELMSIAVRTSTAPLNVVDPIRHEVRGAANDQVLWQVHTMEELASASLARQRFLLLLFGIFAALALLLACIGIYGVLAYLTGQRIPEIGVRLALGASRGDVTWMVFRDSLGMIVLGIGVGLAGALAAARLLVRLVEGVASTEPATFAMMIAVLVVASLIASFVPARRASLVDPMRALRQE